MKFIPLVLCCVLFHLCCKTKNDFAESYFSIRDTYKAEVAVFKDKMKTAITPEAQKALMSEAPDRKTYSDTLKQITKQYPNEDFVADAWVEVYGLNWFVPDSILGNAILQLKNNHVRSPYLKNILPITLTKSRYAGIQGFMEAVLKENPSPEVQGVFSLSYANWLTKDRTSDNYNLEKALALYTDVIEKYSDVEINDMEGFGKIKIGDQAERTVLLLTKYVIGNKAPEIISKNLDGQEVKLSDYLGQVVILDLWATWCGPCIAMIPEQTAMVSEYKNTALKLISVSVDKDAATVQKFHTKTPMPWDHWHNGESGGILTQWNIFQYPTIIIFDKEGIIRHRFDGATSREVLESSIKVLL